jgi:hypothetical protein
MNTKNAPGHLPRVSLGGLPALASIAQTVGRLLVLLGGPGIGKTAIAQTIARALGIPRDRVSVLNYNGASPTEVFGFAVPGEPGADLEWAAPSILPTRHRIGDAPYLVVLDEFADWEPAIQSLWRGAIAPDGVPRVGPHELGHGVFFILTGNRAQDGSRTSKTLSGPVVNRSLVAEVVPRSDEWVEWARSEGLSGPVVDWIGYLSTEQVDGYFAPPVPQPWQGQPFPSPRAWEAVARAYNVAPDPATFRTAALALVGQDAGDTVSVFAEKVYEWAGRVGAIRAGSETLPIHPIDQSATLSAATRVAIRESEADPAAHVAGGHLDWFVDRFLGPASPERAAAGYRAALAAGIPLARHPRCEHLARL